MIDNATIDRIFAAADIVEVVNDFVTLKKKGVNYQACCPFHNEKTPSFVVSPSKGLFKCFGCGKGGNAVTFVMAHENMSYPEALRYVAKKYGIEVEEREITEEEARRNDDRESMMVVSHFAADYFHSELKEGGEGRAIGLSYLRERGIGEASIEKYGLGYCPASGEAFTGAALEAGYREEFLTATGLTIVREAGGYYDRFAGRVIFPIHSISGRVTGFGGRTMRQSDKAKYVNSPESEIYHKSNSLYGLFQAKRAITREDCAILVEGYTDVISMSQSGVENVIASSGTSLTKEQIQLISRFTRNVTIIYDGDPAGIKASLRGIDMVLEAGLNVRIVPLPEGEDPDSFARSRNAAELKAFLKGGEEDFLRFKIKILLGDSGGDPIKRAAVVADVVQSVSVIPDPITRSIYIKECASALDVDHSVLVSEVARKRMAAGSDSQTREFIRRQESAERATAQAAVSRIRAGSSIEELEREIVKYLLKYGWKTFDYKEGRNMVTFRVAKVIVDEVEGNRHPFADPSTDAIFRLYAEMWHKDKDTEIDIRNFTNHSDPNVANTAVDISIAGEKYSISDLWKRHDVAVIDEAERLAIDVPRLAVLYKAKVIEIVIACFQAELEDETLTEEQHKTAMRNIAALNMERKKLSDRLSRVIL